MNTLANPIARPVTSTTGTRLATPSAHVGRMVWATVGVLLSLATWAHWADLDQITRGGGQVIASSHTQVVQVVDGGILHKLQVREGDVVKRGQLLATLEDLKPNASWQETAARAAALRANIARLRAEVFGGAPLFGKDLAAWPEFVSNQQTLFAKRQAAVREEVAALQSALDLARKELDMNLPLLKNGDVSQADVLRLRRQVADLQGQITNRGNKYMQDSQAELSKAEEELAGVLQVLAQRKEQLDNTRLVAPVDGIVKNVRVTTLGAVLKPGEELLSIVPVGDELIVEVKIKPADVAYLKQGLPATVKFDAWDYSIHGSFAGHVSYISADTLSEDTRQGEQTYYRVKVALEQPRLVSHKGHTIDLQPGMTAQVDIKTGSQTVLHYLTKPITKTLSESMGER
jgi:adhesin transport system membrane fusion protein